ncbi:MAG TPA: NrfD/PsrC family molybdoenzyme membrane anchor subunit [Terriglobia bacterium]|nr:NrfD/PsrC family molybdoenzyme membrane anchor subunit [Terriglobia bacterium]
MRYGFVIDNRKCIGCHACTVACKTENHVPVGVNRTWVKYVEKGRFPDTRRYFQVTRCNHCENAPCVEICPVTAMYQRPDGIVDFDSDRCIGCKACMQACPYDAIYIDPERNTAAKCNYCAHRTEVGLEPACVTVCPEQAIVAGDLDNVASPIAQLRERETVRVRKPEAGTRPKLFYIEAEETAIVPTAARHEPFYLWSERNTNLHGGGAVYPPDSPFLQPDALAAYDVAHERPWGWQVPAYMWLKSIGSAPLLLPSLAERFGLLSGDRIRDLALALVALVFTAATTAMLVADLKRKDRFLRVIFTPQRRSWLARGGFILFAYSALCGLFLLARFRDQQTAAEIILWPTLFAGLMAAIYTAFLFAQCKGRELWQTPLLAPHLLVQATLSGAGVLALLPTAWGGSGDAHRLAAIAFLVLLILNFSVVLSEIVIPHGTTHARYAVRLITRGPYRALFWIGAVLLGSVLPLLLLTIGSANAIVLDVAVLLALGGLFAFEWCFVMAGQGVPNS